MSTVLSTADLAVGTHDDDATNTLCMYKLENMIRLENTAVSRLFSF